MLLGLSRKEQKTTSILGNIRILELQNEKVILFGTAYIIRYEDSIHHVILQMYNCPISSLTELSTVSEKSKSLRNMITMMMTTTMIIIMNECDNCIYSFHSVRIFK